MGKLRNRRLSGQRGQVATPPATEAAANRGKKARKPRATKE